jgi:integrase
MGSLKAGKGLPKQVKEKQHRKAMPYADVPAFIAALHGEMATFGRLALELTALTATRSVEARAAEWSEFDLEAKLWTVPASRMKRSKSHIVPLSDAALAVLKRAAALRIVGTNLVFPGANGGPMSDMTLLKVLRDAKEPYHVHGFRSAFTDWAADRGFANAVVEAALAHKTPDATQAAYRRTTYLDERRKLMAAWGAYCASGGRGGAVIPFRKAGGK